MPVQMYVYSAMHCLLFVNWLAKFIPERTPGVNFINVLHANFLYERRFGSLESGFEQTFVRKMCAKNVDEIDSCSQFHQHLLLCPYSFAEKLQSQTVSREKLCKALLYKKACVKC